MPSISDYLDYLQAAGRFVFTTERKGGSRRQHGIEVVCEIRLVNALKQITKASRWRHGKK